METTGGSQNTAKQNHHVSSSTTGIHEISTQSIMQTSALFWQATTTHDAAVITPTNSSSSNGDAFRPIHAVDVDDDDDTVSSNGASVRDDHDSDVVVVVMDHDQKKKNDDDHRADSPLWTNAIIGADCRVHVSSPLGEPKEVRFQTTQHDDDDEALGQESFVLQEQLRNLLQDLSAEKARRFQKEKALVKLAKQLKKRNQQVQIYETKILKMAQFINSLQLELQQQPAAAVAAREDRVRRLRSPSPQLLPEGSTTNNTMVAGGPIPTTERPESPEMIPTLRPTERPESQQQQQPQPRPVVVPTTTTLPASAVSLKNSIEAEDDAAIATRGRHRRSFRLWTLGSIFVIVVMLLLVGAMASIDQYFGGVAVQNFLCAPIRPGTTLVPTVNPQVYEAPWWVPNRGGPLKVILHSTFCPHVPRTSLHWSGDKLVIQTLSDDRTVLVHGRGPAGVQFRVTQPEMSGNDDRRRHVIQLLRTNRAGIALPAPWLS